VTAALGSGVPDLARILQTYVSIADALWQFMPIEQLISTRSKADWHHMMLTDLGIASAFGCAGTEETTTSHV